MRCSNHIGHHHSKWDWIRVTANALQLGMPVSRWRCCLPTTVLRRSPSNLANLTLLLWPILMNHTAGHRAKHNNLLLICSFLPLCACQILFMLRQHCHPLSSSHNSDRVTPLLFKKMDVTFDSLYPPMPDPRHAGQQKRSRSFLASVKGLVKQPSRTRLEPPTIDAPALQPRSTSALGYHSRERSRSPIPRIQAHSWGGSGSSRKVKRSREHVPSMIDYLTLAQLENVWHKQDSYRGSVTTPQTAPNPEIQQMQKRLDGWAPQSTRDPHPMDVHPALRARSPSFDDSAWSRPPSYRP